jgi:hypothetical protein
MHDVQLAEWIGLAKIVAKYVAKKANGGLPEITRTYSNLSNM